MFPMSRRAMPMGLARGVSTTTPAAWVQPQLPSTSMMPPSVRAAAVPRCHRPPPSLRSTHLWPVASLQSPNPLTKSLFRNSRLSGKAPHADCRIVNINRCCAWTQPARIIVHTPRAVSVRVARVHVFQVPQQGTVLPDLHFSPSVAVAAVKSLDVKPAPHGNTHEGLGTLLVACVQMVVAQVEVHLPRA